MTRAPLAALLLLPAFAGCLLEADLNEFESVFGARSVRFEGDHYVIRAPVLEGSFGEEWGAVVVHEVVVPPIDLAGSKTDPGPAGGGGTTRSLDLGDAAVEFRARVRAAYDLANLTVSWGALDENGSVDRWTQPGRATVSPPFAASRAGWIDVAARFHDSLGNVAVASPAMGTVDVHWTVQSAVQPFAPVATPRPSNYDDMADYFPFVIESLAASVEATTSFRGDAAPGTGTDVDLELTSPAGVSLCEGRGAGEGPMDPREASESLGPVSVTHGQWTVRVGTVDCEGHNFTNAGMVPYTLEVHLRHPVGEGPGLQQ